MSGIIHSVIRTCRVYHSPNIAEVVRTDEDIDKLRVVDLTGRQVSRSFDSLANALLKLGRGLCHHRCRPLENGTEEQ